ncbi:MAG: thioredoxin [Rhizobiaceae bacterium]
MSDQGNPYGNGNGNYETRTSFGAAQPSGAEAPTAELVRDTTTAGFSADVIRESRNQPVLVDFWAPWCGPCRQLTPALEKVVREAKGRVKLVKMNIDEHPSIPGQLGIQSIPAVIAFKNGQPVDGFMGAVPESQIRDLIDRVAGPGGGDRIEAALAAAVEARGKGDLRAAAELYAAVLAEAPDNIDAAAALAGILYETGDVEGAGEILAGIPADKADHPDLAAVRARMELDKEVAALGNPAELEQKLAANPKDHQARFDLAMIQNARGEREAAADNLLAIMKADRGWKDDGARQQLLRFFEAWGMMDEATLAARRKLSSLLFS